MPLADDGGLVADGTDNSGAGFRQKVLMDIRHYARQDGLPVTAGLVIRLFAITQGFQFVFWRRVQDAMGGVPLIGRPMRRIWWWLGCLIFGSEIAMDCSIGGGLYVPHPYGIVLGVCDVGDNVVILQNVTVGVRRSDERSRARIEDEAYLSAGCALLGNIIVGTGATIGANAVVTKDVPPGRTAVGVPARLMPEALPNIISVVGAA